MSRAKQQSEGLVVIDRNAAGKMVTRITSRHDLKTMQTPLEHSQAQARRRVC